MSAENDIVERLEALARTCDVLGGSWPSRHNNAYTARGKLIAEAAAEIVRLRGEVYSRANQRQEDLALLDEIRDAIGGGPYDTIAKRIRKAIAPAEAKGDANG